MLDQQIQEVLCTYPSLQYNSKEKKFFGIVEASGNDFYEVEVDINGFPLEFPKVKEVSERIPRTADRHVYEATGYFCFMPKAKEEILLNRTIKSLPVFFEKILIPFLQNNSFYEINEYYLYGEYSHGVRGIIECYQDVLNLTSLLKIGETMLARIRGIKWRPNDLCYCGSSKKIKNCNDHHNAFKELKRIRRETLQNDFQLIFGNP